MAGWLIPVVKAVLPHVGSIISAAKPVFTKKPVEEAANQSTLLQKQIAELQSAVLQNAENIKELAAQLQTTVTALEQGALAAEAKLTLARLVALAALVVSGVAVVLALFAFFGR
jgi:hypothetical protein